MCNYLTTKFAGPRRRSRKAGCLCAVLAHGLPLCWTSRGIGKSGHEVAAGTQDKILAVQRGFAGQSRVARLPQRRTVSRGNGDLVRGLCGARHGRCGTGRYRGIVVGQAVGRAMDLGAAAFSGTFICVGFTRSQLAQCAGGQLSVHLARISLCRIPCSGVGLLLGRTASLATMGALGGAVGNGSILAGGLCLFRDVQGHRHVHRMELPDRIRGGVSPDVAGCTCGQTASRLAAGAYLHYGGILLVFLECPGAVLVERSEQIAHARYFSFTVKVKLPMPPKNVVATMRYSPSSGHSNWMRALRAAAAVIILGQFLAGGVFEPEEGIDVLAHHVNLIRFPLGQFDGVDLANGVGLHRVRCIRGGEFGFNLGHPVLQGQFRGLGNRRFLEWSG